MAVPGLLSDYIIKNYKRLLVCVVPPPEADDHLPPHDVDVTTSVGDGTAVGAPPEASFNIPPSPRAHSLDAPHVTAVAPVDPPAPRWRRRRSTTRIRARRSAGPGPYIYMHDGDELVREDPFRGCVSSRSVGPRSSGDFVVMGCMQV